MKKQTKAQFALCCICFSFLLFQLNNTVIAYIAQSYPDVPQGQMNQIMTLPSLVGLFVSFLIGPLAMKANKRMLLAGSACCVLLYFIIFMLVGSGGPFWMLLVGTALAGINMGACSPLCSSLINDYFAPEKRSSVIAITMAFQTMGSAAIGLVGGAIAGGNNGADWPKAYMCGLIVIPLLVIYLLMMPKKGEYEVVMESQPGEAKAGNKKRLPGMVFVIASINAIVAIAYACFLFNYSTYIISEHQLGDGVQAGLSNTLFNMVGLIVSFTYPFWQKILKKWIGTVGYLCMALGLFMMVLVNTSLVGVYAAAIAIGVGFNLSYPFVSSKIMEITPSELVPVAMSVMFGMVNLIQYFSLNLLGFFGGLLGGGVDNTILAGGIAALISTIAAFLVFNLNKKS